MTNAYLIFCPPAPLLTYQIFPPHIYFSWFILLLVSLELKLPILTKLPTTFMRLGTCPISTAKPSKNRVIQVSEHCMQRETKTSRKLQRYGCSIEQSKQDAAFYSCISANQVKEKALWNLHTQFYNKWTHHILFITTHLMSPAAIKWINRYSW